MALRELLEEFKDIKGFLAAGILDFTGEILDTLSETKKIDLAVVGATFTDILRSANDASGKIGLELTNEMTIVTPQGTVMMASTGINAPVNAIVIVVLDSEGNQALTKMKIKKVIPKLIVELG
ncbi:MAG: hypothetical protein JW996_06135 [Candidatus Cloacimonetes bacterium]|nr:hypothetical protein [Candidatus Cloacimonadota bacterium]